MTGYHFPHKTSQYDDEGFITFFDAFILKVKTGFSLLLFSELDYIKRQQDKVSVCSLSCFIVLLFNHFVKH